MVKKKRQSDAHDNDSSTDTSDEKALQSPTSATGGCQHLKKSLDALKLRKLLKVTGLALDCSLCAKNAKATSNEASAEKTPEDTNYGFEYDNTLWLCLKCGTQLCGRSKNQHALLHFKTPHSDSHALTMNTRSFELWCYECDNEVSAKSSKTLQECVEMVKKLAQKPPRLSLDAAALIVPAKWDSPAETNEFNTFVCQQGDAIALPPPPPPPPIPGMAKRVNDPAATGTACAPPSTALPLLSTGSAASNTQRAKNLEAPLPENLPRVRGLTNLGNTCFFNAVMQCLAQTPYLLDVLKESSEGGEEFILPGGTFKFKDEVDIELPPIKGTLSTWGLLTAALAEALEELQSGGGVFTPNKLFDKLCKNCPQFCGGDQHDSHELLRHLLESVRSEDLRRYQRVILKNLGYENDKEVSEEMRQKCKIYGNQASDRILRPDQVFRGFLVSTLTCQDCYNVSSRHEYFLDMSLPVSVEKPQPPTRRKTSPENQPATSFFLNPAPVGPTKAQLKKEKEKERKAKRAAKHHNTKLTQKLMLEDVTGASGDTAAAAAAAATGETSSATCERASPLSSSSASAEQSDADVEDNLIDDNATKKAIIGPAPAPTKVTADANGNSQVGAAAVAVGAIVNPEKRGDSPENMDKDSLDEEENGKQNSGIATSPANTGASSVASAAVIGGSATNTHVTTTNNSILAVGISEKGANMVRQLSLGEAAATAALTNGEINNADALAAQLEQLQVSEQKAARMRAKRVRTQSYSDWSTTIAPRYQCEDGECSVQSCLNNFTAVELMTGNNKVGCDNCTKRINGDDPKAKTVNTNATKQFLISSPPAVLILHLKRFQLGPRCIFRKLTRAVSFPMVLDIAPFCGSKVKNLPNIDRKQKKLLYALYGVVEHSGGMYGGHYTAYVKVRAKLAGDDKRWKFMPQGSKAELDQDDEQRKKLDELLAKEKARELRMKAADDSDDFSNSDSSSTSSASSGSEAEDASQTPNVDDETPNVPVPPGKWYYVSDSRVQEVNEDAVLRAQAYLLFYERIY